MRCDEIGFFSVIDVILFHTSLSQNNACVCFYFAAVLAEPTLKRVILCPPTTSIAIVILRNIQGTTVMHISHMIVPMILRQTICKSLRLDYGGLGPMC